MGTMEGSLLIDAHISELQCGALLFPSSASRLNLGGGNYYCTERRAFMRDAQVFPAILLDPRTGSIAAPTGIHVLGSTALVAVVRR